LLGSLEVWMRLIQLRAPSVHRTSMRDLQLTWRQRLRRPSAAIGLLAEATNKAVVTAIDEKPAAATKKRKRAVGQKAAPLDPLSTPAHTSGSSPIESPRSSQSLPLLPPISARNLPVGVAYIAGVDPSEFTVSCHAFAMILLTSPGHSNEASGDS
jgi:hypothetical protein